MKSAFKRVMAAVVCVSISFSSYANINDELKKTFGDLVNVSQPGVYEGQTRGVITGGSMYVRSTITKPNLISFKPPSLSAGCGGIDIFGGSFSFINAQQFEQLLQSIASNARGYAFGLAMDIVCPTCSAQMKELQKKIQEMNAKMQSSCEIAKNIVDPVDKALKSLNEGATIAATAEGLYSDWFDAKPINRRGGAPTNAANDLSETQLAAANLTGNIVWSSLEKSNVASWYSNVAANKQQLHQIMMSLAGTAIIKKGTATDGTGALEPDVRSGILDFKDFLNGSESATVFTCTDSYDSDKCLRMSTDTIQIKGMKKMVDLMLYGDGSAGTGIIAKLRDKGTLSTLTSDEADFVNAASPGILGLLHDFAHDLRAARQVGDIFSEVLAQEMAINFVNEMMVNVGSAVNANKNVANLKDQYVRIMESARDKIHKQRESSALTLQGTANAFMSAAYVRASLKQRIDANRDPVVNY